jgi:sulfatase maturation enzyme AslB (radical SAM superfamily)
MATAPAPATSPFQDPCARPLDPAKFRDPFVTAKGEKRAHVTLERLDTLWINTGTLCNLACKTCYIESSPHNDALVYLSAAEVDRYLDEAEGLGTREIGFTGGEPFMNRDIIAMLRSALDRGFEVLVLTNAMRPMRRFENQLKVLVLEHGERLTMRVSLDHHSQAIHEAERGPRTWDKALDGLRWLARHGFRIIVKRKGAERPAVIACTLLPYDGQFELGGTLKTARRSVQLNHPHCAKFCVLGGASCSG